MDRDNKWQKVPVGTLPYNSNPFQQESLIEEGSEVEDSSIKTKNVCFQSLQHWAICL